MPALIGRTQKKTVFFSGKYLAVREREERYEREAFENRMLEVIYQSPLSPSVEKMERAEKRSHPCAKSALLNGILGLMNNDSCQGRGTLKNIYDAPPLVELRTYIPTVDTIPDQKN